MRQFELKLYFLPKRNYKKNLKEFENGFTVKS